MSYTPRTNNPITFGITLNGKKDYTCLEVENFWECADSIEPLWLMHDYRDFLQAWLNGKIKKNTLVDIDVLKLFADDLDNRADIDYREGHWDDEPSIVRGGKFFDRRAKEMKSYLMMGA